uniref:NADH dehydrogenase subunit 6 n=1 Tax=Vignadula atrata TaxID=1289577 RepID=UPI001FA6CFAB|nr:NADH dehydrogenase subunit 6 [Vignadula atrata]ULT46702.1 NADH dehydrogenase subunit 6 [Vignadula atrata]
MMLVFLVVSVSMVLSLMVSVNQPLVLALKLGIVAVFSSLMIGVECSSLMGYVIFLIYVGGLMVLFGYVLSIFPNQRFVKPYIPSKFFCFFLLCFIFMSFDVGINCFSVVGDFSGYNVASLIYVFISFLLLFALLLVVIMCNKGRIPLRSVF